jgi:hypothetical protein
MAPNIGASFAHTLTAAGIAAVPFVAVMAATGSSVAGAVVGAVVAFIATLLFIIREGRQVAVEQVLKTTSIDPTLASEVNKSTHTSSFVLWNLSAQKNAVEKVLENAAVSYEDKQAVLDAASIGLGEAFSKTSSNLNAALQGFSPVIAVVFFIAMALFPLG